MVTLQLQGFQAAAVNIQQKVSVVNKPLQISCVFPTEILHFSLASIQTSAALRTLAEDDNGR